MTIIESLSVSLFCIALVFLVLACVFALIKILSRVLKGGVLKKAGISVAAKDEAVPPAVKIAGEADDNGVSTGELKLMDVDEKTAAMAMAIVSHESRIPLAELSFKSIKAVE